MIDFEVFFKITYGLYIVSAGDKKSKNGFISNSVFQVTSEPPQFAACCNKDNFTTGLILEHKFFSISVLNKETSKEIIGSFGYKSGRNINKFDDVNFRIGTTGTPVILSNCVAFIECEVAEIFDAGTHLIIIGKAVNSEILDDKSEVLTYEYYRKVKKGIAPKNAPTYINRKKLTKPK
ncbi:MAG: flavin reductase [Bacteroidales bacterium]|nr:flavin reductase [Bacteroidales bacterium]